MWSIPANGSSGSSVGVEQAQAQTANSSGSADLFVSNAGWNLSSAAGVVAATGGGATSNDSEPSPATTASPASQGRAPATVNTGPRSAQPVAQAPQSSASVPQASTSAAASGKVKRRKWTREERAEHSTIEKKRREDFNVSLLDLARKLPSISSIKRVNKRVIVKAALEHVDTERKLVLDALPDIRGLSQERDDLLKELNDWRRSAGQQDRSASVDAKASIDNLSRVEAYAFNAFAGGFGGNDDDEMDADPMSATEKPVPKAAPRRMSLTSRTLSSQTVPTFDSAPPPPTSAPLPSTSLPDFMQQQPGSNTGLLFDESFLQSTIGNAASNAIAAFPQNSPTPADVAQLLSDSTIQDMAVRHLLNSPSFQEALRGSMNRYQPSQASPFSFGQVANSFNFSSPALQSQTQAGSGLTPPNTFQQHQQSQQQPQQQQQQQDGPFQNPLSPMSAFLYSYGPSPTNPSYQSSNNQSYPY